MESSGIRPITLGININISEVGCYQVWFEARNSGVGADGKNFVHKYELMIDGKNAEFQWERLDAMRIRVYSDSSIQLGNVINHMRFSEIPLDVQ